VRKTTEIIWILGITIAILSAPIGLMRLINMLWAGHYHKVIIPLIIVLGLYNLLAKLLKRELKYDILSLSLFISIIFGTLIGFINFQTNELRYFTSHFFGSLFMLTVYLSGLNFSNNAKWIEPFIAKSSFWLTLVFFIILLLFWFINIVFFGGNLYLGVGTGYLVLPFAYFLVYSKYNWAVVVFFLILISGKRGPLMAAIVVFLIYVPFFMKKSPLKVILFFSFLVLMFSYLTYITEGLTNFNMFPPFLSGSLQKLSTLNPNSDSYNEDLAFSGRNQELILASAHFAKSVINFFTGLGFGWFYFFGADIQGSTTTDFNVHYIHIAPINFIFSFGLPLGLFILVSMLLIAIKAYVISLMRPQSKITILILLFWIGDFVNSFSGYSYPIDPLFWLSLSYLKVNFEKYRFNLNRI
jgi:hypothetical protein